jgi:hypothetical protein
MFTKWFWADKKKLREKLIFQLNIAEHMTFFGQCFEKLTFSYMLEWFYIILESSDNLDI